MTVTANTTRPATGACACPTCGYDENGDLRVVDAYEELRPPFDEPRGGIFAVWGDDPRDHTLHGLTLCPACDERLTAESVVPR